MVVNVNGITLSSGKSSVFYYDLRKVSFDPIGANLIADLLFEKIHKAKSVGGLEIGAIPITMAILMKCGLSGFVVRKHVKDHGLKYMVEGNLDSPVVIVDDVLTTGASLIKAIQAVKDEGVNVNGVFCILDREENNELKNNNIKYTSLFKHSDFEPFIDAKIQKQKTQKPTI
ncbi:MAG: phosphoribosyltransferase family protein [Candidatus Nitrosopolaris sp.]